jgi:ribosomal protein S18 acetylase RimI-like enzyme
MDRSVEHIEFAMHCPNLASVPEIALPDGYRLRTFREGEEAIWADIERRAGEFSSVDRGLGAFERDFRSGYAELPDRMFFLEHAVEGPIGTSTAWYGELDGRRMGQLHWVAIVPEHQGKGLAKPLVARVLHRLANDTGEAFLTTQTWSWRAVGLYRKFGFTEVVDRPDVERAITIVNERLAQRLA